MNSGEMYNGEVNIENMRNVMRNYSLKNFKKMLERRNIQEIIDFKDSKLSNRISLFYALGMDFDFCHMPAHIEQIEECFSCMMVYLVYAMRKPNTRRYEIKFLERGIEFTAEDALLYQNMKLEFYKGSYSFEEICSASDLSKRIKGSIDNKVIASYIEYEDNGLNDSIIVKTRLDEKRLDDNGFVIKQITEESDGIIRSKKSIERDGLKVNLDGNNTIKWDGSALNLNTEDAYDITFFNNMAFIISRFPETQTYYESIVGKDVVSSILKGIRQID